MNIAKKFSRQLLDDLKGMTGERSLGGVSSPSEGNTYLPSQTLTQPKVMIIEE
jgi:hypothetical protein